MNNKKTKLKIYNIKVRYIDGREDTFIDVIDEKWIDEIGIYIISQKKGKFIIDTKIRVQQITMIEISCVEDSDMERVNCNNAPCQTEQSNNRPSAGRIKRFTK